MARGDKNYDSVVRKVNSGQSSGSKISAIHKMVEALIQEDNDEAIAALQQYLQLKSRSILLGEEDDKEEKDMKSDDSDTSDEDVDSDSDDSDSDVDSDSDDSDSDDSDSESDDDSGEEMSDEDYEDYEEDEELKVVRRKKKKMKEGQWLEKPPTPKRDFYGWKPLHAVDKKGKAQEYHSNGKQAPKGDSETAKPHKKNDTQSRTQEFKGNDARELGRGVKDNNQSDHRRGQRSNRT